MNELQQKQAQELKEAVQFCKDHNLLMKDELEKLANKDTVKEMTLRCVARMRMYLQQHPEMK